MTSFWLWIGTWIIRPFIRLLDWLSPLGDLAARWWVGWVFFKSALTKISSWSTTILLFQYVYHVPWLSSEVAAIIGTIAEIVLPILLVLGLGGRIVIFIFFIYNIVAVVSYPFLLTPDGAIGLGQHIGWGLLLALLMFHGPGKLSLDTLVKRWYTRRVRREIRQTDGL
jgi:putative oxidoreductase